MSAVDLRGVLPASYDPVCPAAPAQPPGAAAAPPLGPAGGDVVLLPPKPECRCAGVCDCCPCCADFDCGLRGLCSVMFMQAGTAALQIATLTTLEEQFGLSRAKMGVLVVMDEVAEIALGTATAHFLRGNKPVAMGAGQLVHAASLLVIATARSNPQLFLGALLMGIGKVPFWVLFAAHIDDNVADKTRIPGSFARVLVCAFFGAACVIAAATRTLRRCGGDDDGGAGCHGAAGGAMPGDGATATIPPALPGGGCEGEEMWRRLFLLCAVVIVAPALWLMQSRMRYPSAPLTLRSPAARSAGAGRGAAAADQRGSSGSAGYCGDSSGDGECGDSGGSTVPGGDGARSPPPKLELREEGREARGSEAPFIVAYRAVLGDPRIVLMVCRAVVIHFFVKAMVPFVPWFFERRLCLARGTASALLMPVIFAMISGMLAGGAAVRRLQWGVREQLRLMITGEALGVALCWVFLSGQASVICVAFCVGNFVSAASMPSTIALHQRFVPPEFKAHSTALFQGAARLSGIFGPITFGALLDMEGEGQVPEARWLFCLWLGVGSGLICCLAVAVYVVHVTGRYPDTHSSVTVIRVAARSHSTPPLVRR